MAVCTAASFTQLQAALERQLAWAQDFVGVGDFWSAAEALRDADALSTELRNDTEQARTR